MGVHVVKVPDVGEGVAEVELVSWAVDVGQQVVRNQVLAEVMTDKANVEIPSPVAGVIAALNGDIGSTMAVGSSLIELTVEGAGMPPEASTGATAGSATVVPEVPAEAGSEAAGSAPEIPAEAGSAAAGSASGALARSGPGRVSVEAGAGSARPSQNDRVAGSAKGTTSDERPTQPEGAGAPGPEARASRPGPVSAGGRAGGEGPPRPEGERPRATPAVRHRAREAGVDLRRVAGSGPAGRITHDDLDGYLAGDQALAGPAPTRGRANTAVEEQPIVGIRRKIAEHMVASATTIPHITYVEEVDVTAVEDLRSTLNEQRSDAQPRLTLLPFLVRALVQVLPDFPSMNAHVDDDRGVLTTFGGVHVGIATQTPNGLVVPVIRHAEARSIWAIAEQINAQAEAARTGRSAPADLRGSTITITSLGAVGGLVTTPVINKPEVAIVGVNKIVTRPVWVDTAFVPRSMMNLSSSFDHRVVDGWDAALFVQGLRRALEQPALLFMDEA